MRDVRDAWTQGSAGVSKVGICPRQTTNNAPLTHVLAAKSDEVLHGRVRAALRNSAQKLAARGGEWWEGGGLRDLLEAGVRRCPPPRSRSEPLREAECIVAALEFVVLGQLSFKAGEVGGRQRGALDYGLVNNDKQQTWSQTPATCLFTLPIKPAASSSRKFVPISTLQQRCRE